RAIANRSKVPNSPNYSPILPRAEGRGQIRKPGAGESADGALPVSDRNRPGAHPASPREWPRTWTRSKAWPARHHRVESSGPALIGRPTRHARGFVLLGPWTLDRILSRNRTRRRRRDRTVDSVPRLPRGSMGLGYRNAGRTDLGPRGRSSR